MTSDSVHQPPAASASERGLPRAEVDRRGMAMLSGGHACVDACQGAVPALLPFMVVEHDLSLAAASALVLAATVSSSIVQPIFGA